jgi:AcrR family transcriptional regulator
LYEYFDGKDAIIDALCLRGNDQLVRYLKAVDTALPLQEYFVQLLRRYVDFARENPEFYTLMFTQSPSKMTEPPTETHPDDAFAILLNAVQRGIDENVFQTREGHDAFEIAYNFWAMAHGTAMLQTRYLTALEFDFAAADAVAVEAFLRGLSPL